MTDQLEVRGTPDVVDAEWMTRVMEVAGVAAGETISEIDFEGFIGTGQMSRNGRFKLHWSNRGERPETVMVKFASDDETARNSGYLNGGYLTELSFYGRLAGQMKVRVPHCYAALFDETKPDFVLVMEDLCHSKQGDQLTGLSVDQCALALSGAVGFHAPRWGDPSLVEFAPHKPPPEAFGEMLVPIYDWALGEFEKRLGERIDDDILTLMRDLNGKIDLWLNSSQLPATLIHMDFRADNLMFGIDDQAPPLVVIDWQTATVGPALWDVAYLIGAALPPAERAQREQELLKQYLAEMQTAGVTIDFDTAWREYRLGAIWGVVMAVVATSGAEETERGNDMLTQMAQSHGRHAIELDSVSLLC